MNDVYVLLGSNINPEKNILLALEYLDRNFKILQVSNTWQTKPIGSSADDFLNTAVRLETALSAYDLKEKCLCQIEEVLGRIRQSDKNAPRTIDLDIVVFNGKVIDDAVFKYDHLVLPFSELIPDLVGPENKVPLKILAEEMIQKTLAKKFKFLLPPFEK
ncbi:MAG: bifunctional folate synthesis protein [Chloroflexi bacterium]|nr:MAG: bifunctional folate synthesis protein [Chloroflexota bacterium]MBA4374780.1 2-amino-4-hydroxy-6-hydroxymethyldihydropteridine diphosphokinase [Anaerolinea sp.]